MAGRSDDGQPPCKKRMDFMDNSTRLLYISMEMELKARDDLQKLDMDMYHANVLHMGLLGRLKQLGDKLKKKQNAAEKLRIMIKNTTNEIEKSKNEQDEMLTVRRKLEKRKTYYDFCQRLLNNDPEDSSLWYFTGAECSVCLDKYQDMAKLNHCQHLLCVDCLTSWFETSHSCPLCRSEIIGYDVFDRTLMRTEYVTATQHHEGISKVVDDTSRVPGGPENEPRPPAVVRAPMIRLRNDIFYTPPQSGS
ncbi:E3 ubiquitin-protein ligase rnf8-A-like [Acyrthosiphon pisum]|uniref:RING-type domain-containing protein n=1 Tax=Acyrthosiphon pisum TaxID=7029 RepID=A0A8R2JMV7_ACYPI|nr:E3 ubiquitin-protein ligase rnf8-A-like [Acyrthosiphon pisum]